jgi:hypothetical protein
MRAPKLMELVRIKPYNYAIIIHFIPLYAIVDGYIWSLMTVNSGELLRDNGRGGELAALHFALVSALE